MDLFMNSYKDTTSQEPIWDLSMDFVKGDFNTVSLDAEVKQRAIIASFIQKGTVPQMKEFGVDWTGLLTGEVAPSEINSSILKNIQECADTYGYIPSYTVVNGKLVVSIEELK